MSTTGFLLSEAYGMNLTVLKFQGGPQCYRQVSKESSDVEGKLNLFGSTVS